MKLGCSFGSFPVATRFHLVSPARGKLAATSGPSDEHMAGDFIMDSKDSPVNGTSTSVEPAMSDRPGEREAGCGGHSKWMLITGSSSGDA